MIRTLFWNDGTICIVEFNSHTIPKLTTLCYRLGKKREDVEHDINGRLPYKYKWVDNMWKQNQEKFPVDNHKILFLHDTDPKKYHEYFFTGLTTQKPKAKTVNIIISWLNRGKEIIQAEMDSEHDLHKIISSALCNGGYSQAAIHSIKYWKIEDEYIKYQWNTNIHEWTTMG